MPSRQATGCTPPRAPAVGLAGRTSPGPRLAFWRAAPMGKRSRRRRAGSPRPPSRRQLKRARAGVAQSLAELLTLAFDPEVAPEAVARALLDSAADRALPPELAEVLLETGSDRAALVAEAALSMEGDGLAALTLAAHVAGADGDSRHAVELPCQSPHRRRTSPRGTRPRPPCLPGGPGRLGMATALCRRPRCRSRASRSRFAGSLSLRNRAAACLLLPQRGDRSP